MEKTIVRKAKRHDVSETRSQITNIDAPEVAAKLFQIEQVKVNDKMRGFIHLHVHTEYSILDGVGRIDDFVRSCAANGVKRIAITDHRTTSGWFPFHKECKNHGIKPIFGIEVDFCYEYPETGNSRDVDRIHLVLLARNDVGFGNILKLSTESWTNCYGGKPVASWDSICRHKKGLVCLTACLNGPVNREIIKRTGKEEEVLLKLKEVFGKHLYVELQSLELEDQIRCNMRLVELAGKHGLKTVITNDVHYVKKSDSKFQDALVAIRLHKTMQELEMESVAGGEVRTRHNYLKGMMAQRKTFSEFNPNLPGDVLRRSLRNTVRLGESLNSEFKTYDELMPVVEPDKGFEDNEQYMRHVVAGFDLVPYREKTREKWELKIKEARTKEERGRWKDRLAGIDEEYSERLEYEMSLIVSKKYVDYFVLIHRIYKFADRKGIAINPGRGSVAGSLVALCLGVTKVDPVFYDLLFERFISEHRHDLPDVDMDFDDTRRDEIKQYLEEIYDPSCVASITNFGRMKEKMILDDLARVMKIPKAVVETVKSRLVSHSSGDARQGMILRESIKMFKELQEIRDRYPVFFEYAEKLEGQVRNLGVHAAGVVVSPKPLTNYLAVEDRGGVRVTSYSGKDMEALGLVKLDILGLSTLGEIDTAEKLIGRSIGWEEIDYEDPRVLDMFNEGDTTGVFQFECIDGDAEVLTELGWRSIRGLYVDSRQRVVPGSSNSRVSFVDLCGVVNPGVENRPVSGGAFVHDVGRKECFKVTTEDGVELIASPDHVFFTPSGEEVRLADLTEGDEVLLYEDKQWSL